ncbi:hypothetical protein PT2222_10106 [Paraburkholderia tropica]
MSDGCVSAEPSAAACGVVARWPSRVTRRLSFSMPRRPRVSASRCGPALSTERRCARTSFVRVEVVSGIEGRSGSGRRDGAARAADRDIFGSGHFNISPEDLLEAASGGVLRPVRRVRRLRRSVRFGTDVARFRWCIDVELP